MQRLYHGIQRNTRILYWHKVDVSQSTFKCQFYSKPERYLPEKKYLVTLTNACITVKSFLILLSECSATSIYLSYCYNQFALYNWVFNTSYFIQLQHSKYHQSKYQDIAVVSWYILVGTKKVRELKENITSCKQKYYLSCKECGNPTS